MPDGQSARTAKPAAAPVSARRSGRKSQKGDGSAATRRVSKARKPTAAAGDRAATEALIERAALELLEENGVLAGLNLRETADRANVNRGLLYMYFGSRQAVLRSAMRKRSAEAPTFDSPQRAELPFIDRAVRDLLHVSSERSQVRIHALLHLDDDPKIHIAPFLKESVVLLKKDQEAGAIPTDIDLEALHLLLVSLDAGYGLYRERLASDANEVPEKLDERVVKTLRQVLSCLGKQGGTPREGRDLPA